MTAAPPLACDNSLDVDCTVSSFPARELKGLWSNETVPAYACPRGRYLLKKDYAPFGTTLVEGVEIRNLGNIGVIILHRLKQQVTRPGSTLPWWLPYGTETGFYASATNWRTTSQSYRVILHCTSDPNHSTFLQSG